MTPLEVHRLTPDITPLLRKSLAEYAAEQRGANTPSDEDWAIADQLIEMVEQMSGELRPEGQPIVEPAETHPQRR